MVIKNNFRIKILKFLNNYNEVNNFDDFIEFSINDLIFMFRQAGYSLPAYQDENRAISMLLLRLKNSGYLKTKKVEVIKRRRDRRSKIKKMLIFKIKKNARNKEREFLYQIDPLRFTKIRNYIEYKENEIERRLN